MDRDELVGRILEIAGDYRKGEIAKFDAKHVEKWINQFPVSENHKNVILQEVGHMLGNYYISRERAKKNLISMFTTMKEERAGGCSTYDVNFLRTQEDGKSQSEILLLADEILKADRGVGTKDCGGSKVYLYLDDCIYSGNKWRYGVANSQQLAQVGKGAVLVSYHFAIYSVGYNYAKWYVDNFMAKREGVAKHFRRDFFRNDRFEKEELDILWPQYVKGNGQVDTFAKHSSAACAAKGWTMRPLFRANQAVSAKIFTSPANQSIVEQAFLAVGAKLFCAAQNPAPSMRPMGFEVIATIGFGTPVVTWRNIPNNAPLALWYGDPSCGPKHPLGMWYPLFPRKV